MDFAGEGAHGEFTVSEYSTGDVADWTVFAAISRSDNDGTVDDDPDAQWIIKKYKITVNGPGTVKLVSSDSAGTLVDLTGAFEFVSAGSIEEVDLHLLVGVGLDLAYVTTGGLSAWVTVTCRADRPCFCRTVGPLVP
mgnify:CR=1 FL=1